jgi:Cu(I)/Ag(I) efflux system membrane fusion protein
MKKKWRNREMGNSKMENGKLKLENGNSKMENGNLKFEVGNSKMENGNCKLGPGGLEQDSRRKPMSSIFNFQFSILKLQFSNFTFQTSLLAILLITSCSKDNAHQHDTYTCPMHPTVIADRPGVCPVCGMDLVRKARSGEEVEITEDMAKLLKSPNETVVASIKTIKGQYKSLPVSINAQGIVTYDTRNIYSIPSRVAGRLEKVYLKYAYQPISKGEKIAEIYSPELITSQQELLFLLENDSENKVLIDATKNKLKLLGMTGSQIANVIQRKQTSTTFVIYSPYSGYVITTQQAPSTSASPQNKTRGSMSDEMGSALPSSPATSTENKSLDAIIREGTYVSAGQVLFSVVNNEALRIELDLPAHQSGAIKKGDKLELDFGNGNTDQASIDFIQPFFTEGQDFVKLRLYTKNVKNLHIGHLVTANILLSSTESLWVPKESVLDLGTNKIVFVKDRGVLKPKKVTTGFTSTGLIQITSGLASSDEIAINAQYLIDSESFVER